MAARLALGLVLVAAAAGAHAQATPAASAERPARPAPVDDRLSRRLPPAPVPPVYGAGFRLRSLAADPIPVVPVPPSKSPGLDVPSYVDPAYGTYVYRVTAGNDFKNANRVRHDYSRRQAFNSNNSRFVAGTRNGYWLLYDARTFRVLPRSGTDGALRGLAGDAEAIWHPRDPQTLFYCSGLVWHAKNVETDRDSVMADFRGRLPWPAATQAWTKGEGTSSADGRYWAFMASSYDEKTQQNRIYGLFTYDREQDRVIGTLDAAQFGRAFPDHISMSPSGRYAVPSWAYQKTLGTRAYTLDFSSFRQLHTASEHSDLALGPDGEDVYVYADYDAGAIKARTVATGSVFEIMRLYPRPGTGYGVHVSGQAFERRGWVLLSTFADNARHGKDQPDPQIEPMYRKLMLVELRPGGRRLAVAHTRTGPRFGGYFGEPQATISRDGSRILFASNFDDGGEPSSYLVLVPPQAYD